MTTEYTEPEKGEVDASASEKEIHDFLIDEDDEDMRADLFVVQRFPHLSRTFLQQAFHSGDVLVNEQPIKKNYMLTAGEQLAIKLPDSPDSTLRPVAIPLNIVYEDEHIVAINKESGMVTHPGAGTGEDTLVHALLHHTDGKLCKRAGAERPGVVHRLDKGTSGVILFAKDDASYTGLIKQFAQRSLNKQYLALVQYAPELNSGTVKEPIGRDVASRVKMSIRQDGRDAHTDWSVEIRKEGYALIRCWIHSGRTHQIRVHMSHVGHPLLGDTTYGFHVNEWRLPRPQRVMLHASRLILTHPVTGKHLDLHAKLPEDFLPYLKKEKSQLA